MRNNPVRTLADLGQSCWLDFIRRGMISSGQLQHLVQEDGLGGWISNFSILEKVIGGSHDYDGAIRKLALEDKHTDIIHEALAVEDGRLGADILRPAFEESGGRDGFVCLEVSPHLSHDGEGIVEQARRLWGTLDRPNGMIVVPATIEGLPAITRLTDEGINLCVTLLFGLGRYRKVVEAYLAGLEERAGRGQPLDRVVSLASFFINPLDSLVDPLLEERMGGSEDQVAKELHGEIAISVAKAAYGIFHDLFGGERWARLAEKGARPQRLMWARTRTVNPLFSDVKYVDALIGPQTVCAMAQETLDAYRDHGQPEARLDQGLEEARARLQRLEDLGFSLEDMARQLEVERLERRIKTFDRLMDSLEAERVASLGPKVETVELHMSRYERNVQKRIIQLGEEGFSPRLWRKDGSLWGMEAKGAASLGWLNVADRMAGDMDGLLQFALEVRQRGFRHGLHIGMGGSSMAALTIKRIFSSADQILPLTVLDSTDPTTILAAERSLPLSDTLFILASKSGTTLETRALGEHFYERLRRLKGDQAGGNFVAITDPGSPLEELARERGFRKVFYSFPDMGGRYAALSPFGLLPATLMGLNVREMVDRARRMAHATAPSVPIQENPGTTLGAVLGELALRGRDKLTLVMAEILSPLGFWLEQLLGESTGKGGKGIVPVVGEPLGRGEGLYGEDRLFACFSLRRGDELEREVACLEREGHPMIRIHLDGLMDLGQEFFRWEVATATAGAILGVNPFDQPDVAESEDHTRRLLEEAGPRGGLAEEEPLLSEGGLRFYGEGRARGAVELIREFLYGGKAGDYVALLAFLTEERGIDRALQGLRLTLRDRLGLATTLGYGPRFLHSTGQLHKGGPSKGLYIQLLANDPDDIAVPGRPYTFGLLKAAQALGDRQTLRRLGRPILAVHLGDDIPRGLAALHDMVKSAIKPKAER